MGLPWLLNGKNLLSECKMWDNAGREDVRLEKEIAQPTQYS